MDSLPVNIFDICVILMLLVGALIGLTLGFVRGGLFVMSWIGAALATLYGFTPAQPIARKYIESEFFADLTTGVAIFLVSLVILFLISSMIGGWVRNSRLNALDRSLGLLAGLLTGALIIVAAYAVAESTWTPEEHPKWVQEAKSLPLIQTGTVILRAVTPKNLQIFGTSSARTASRKVKDAMELKQTYDSLLKPDGTDSQRADRPGYDSKERRALDRTIQGLQ